MRYIKFRSEKNTHSLWQKMDGHILIHVLKLVFTTKRGGGERTTGPCEENVSVVKIIVRHVEHGIGNGRADVC